MNLKNKLQKISSPNKSNWVEEAGESLAKQGVRRKARQIALRVLQILKEKNITQTELGQRMGVSRQQITKIVKGQENITLETIDKLEQALNATIITIGAVKEPLPKSQPDFKRIVAIVNINKPALINIRPQTQTTQSKKFQVKTSWGKRFSSHSTENTNYTTLLENYDYSKS